MKVLLIKDKSLVKSVFFATVGAGNLMDPLQSEDGYEVNGMAHFIEHMIFMGNEKNPDENHLNNFIKKHGGMKNGVTTPDMTQFFFEI